MKIIAIYKQREDGKFQFVAAFDSDSVNALMESTIESLKRSGETITKAEIISKHPESFVIPTTINR